MRNDLLWGRRTQNRVPQTDICDKSVDLQPRLAARNVDHVYVVRHNLAPSEIDVFDLDGSVADCLQL